MIIQPILRHVGPHDILCRACESQLPMRFSASFKDWQCRNCSYVVTDQDAAALRLGPHAIPNRVMPPAPAHLPGFHWVSDGAGYGFYQRTQEPGQSIRRSASRSLWIDLRPSIVFVAVILAIVWMCQ